MNKELGVYLNNMHKTFMSAISRSKYPKETFISINGLKIKLCFMEEALYSSIIPSFEHLICDEAQDEAFIINIWDDRSTDIIFPDSPWSKDISRATDKILMFNKDQVHMLYNPASKVYSLIDADTKIAYYHVPDAYLIPYYERSSPFRMILHWSLEQNGMHLIHSAAVGIEGKGILLVGKGASGKSTTALASLINGLDYIGDDYIAVSRDSDPMAFSIYNSVEVNNDILDKIPGLGGCVDNPERLDTEKALIFLNRNFNRNIIRQLTIKAIVMPVITGEPVSHIYGISPIIAFAELASSTIFQMPGSGRAMLSGLKKVLDDTPVYAMKLGNNFSEITNTLCKFIKAF
jgi:hypothetical protein